MYSFISCLQNGYIIQHAFVWKLIIHLPNNIHFSNGRCGYETVASKYYLQFVFLHENSLYLDINTNVPGGNYAVERGEFQTILCLYFSWK